MVIHSDIYASNMMISVTAINFVVFVYESGRNSLIIGPPMFYWKYYGKFSSDTRLSDMDVNN